MKTNDEKEIWFFLSHSNKDFEKVRKIRNYLEEKGCRPLMFFLKCLSNDDEIDELIKREIDCRMRFVICDSENARRSKWVQSEVAYIQSKDRVCEVLDLNAPEGEIERKLDLMVKRTRAFVSYSRNDHAFVEGVMAIARKYDIRFFWDVQDLMAGVNFADCERDTIGLAEQFLLFGSERYFHSMWGRMELEAAIRQGTTIRVLWLDKPSECVSDENGDLFDKLSTLDAESQTDLSAIESPREKTDAAIEAIVNWLMPCWDVYTMANNFLNGIGCPADAAEAERLFGIAYRRADQLDSKGYPGGTLVLARCEANGHGTPRNLQNALFDYQNYLHHVFSPDVKKEMELIKEMLDRETKR